MRAYIVEPGERGMPKDGWSWEEASKKVSEITPLIQRKYPEVIVAHTSYFPNTEIINTLVIHVPEELTREMIEKEFSCGLLPVAYEPKSS